MPHPNIVSAAYIVYTYIAKPTQTLSQQSTQMKRYYMHVSPVVVHIICLYRSPNITTHGASLVTPTPLNEMSFVLHQPNVSKACDVSR